MGTITGFGAGPKTFVIDPQRLIRIAAVTREVLTEARRVVPGPDGADHLRRIHGRICGELRAALPPKLYEELSELTPDVQDASLRDLLFAHAEILGWREGLFQAIRISLAQRISAKEIPGPAGIEAGAGPERPDPRYL
jgi:hypothetical protein